MPPPREPRMLAPGHSTAVSCTSENARIVERHSTPRGADRQMSRVTRRSFLSTTGSASIAWPLIPRFDLAWQPSSRPPESRQIVTFDEPGFPEVDAFPLRGVPGARVTTGTAELIDALRPGAVLVWRHGAAFPAEAWKAIHDFLDGGGGLLYAGGEPWTRPVVGPRGSRRVEPRTLAQLQACLKKVVEEAEKIQPEFVRVKVIADALP